MKVSIMDGIVSLTGENAIEGLALFQLYTESASKQQQVRAVTPQFIPDKEKDGKTPCAVCGKWVKGMKLHMNLSHGPGRDKLEARMERMRSANPNYKIHEKKAAGTKAKSAWSGKHRKECPKCGGKYKNLKTHDRAVHQGIYIGRGHPARTSYDNGNAVPINTKYNDAGAAEPRRVELLS